MLHLKIEKVLWNIICTFWKELYLKDGKPITKAVDRSYTRLKTLSKCIHIGADTNKMSLLPSKTILIIFDDATSRWFHCKGEHMIWLITATYENIWSHTHIHTHTHTHIHTHIYTDTYTHTH